jgi:hypothetical protein
MIVSPELGHVLARFIRAIAVLALPWNLQLEWLRSLGLGEPGNCDELALEFDEGYRRVEALVGAGLIPERAMPDLRALDSILGEMSGPGRADVWTIDSLRGADTWARVRQIAGQCVCALN